MPCESRGDYRKPVDMEAPDSRMASADTASSSSWKMAVLRLGLSPNRNSMRLDLEHPGVAERWRTISHRLVTLNADHEAAMSREKPDSPAWKGHYRCKHDLMMWEHYLGDFLGREFWPKDGQPPSSQAPSAIASMETTRAWERDPPNVAFMLREFLTTTWLLLLSSLWQTKRAGQPMPETVADILGSQIAFNSKEIDSPQAMADYASVFDHLEKQAAWRRTCEDVSSFLRKVGGSPAAGDAVSCIEENLSMINEYAYTARRAIKDRQQADADGIPAMQAALKNKDEEIARLRELLDEERKTSTELRRMALFIRDRGLMEGFGRLGSRQSSSTQRWKDWVSRALQHAWINRDNAVSENPFCVLFRHADEQQKRQVVEKAQRLYADLCYDIHQADLQINLGDSDVTDTFRRRFLKAMEPKYCGVDGNVDLEREMQRYG
jgi:hypothetical protein